MYQQTISKYNCPEELKPYASYHIDNVSIPDMDEAFQTIHDTEVNTPAKQKAFEHAKALYQSARPGYLKQVLRQLLAEEIRSTITNYSDQVKEYEKNYTEAQSNSTEYSRGRQIADAIKYVAIYPLFGILRALMLVTPGIVIRLLLIVLFKLFNILASTVAGEITSLDLLAENMWEGVKRSTKHCGFLLWIPLGATIVFKLALDDAGGVTQNSESAITKIIIAFVFLSLLNLAASVLIQILKKPMSLLNAKREYFRTNETEAENVYRHIRSNMQDIEQLENEINKRAYLAAREIGAIRGLEPAEGIREAQTLYPLQSLQNGRELEDLSQVIIIPANRKKIMDVYRKEHPLRMIGR